MKILPQTVIGTYYEKKLSNDGRESPVKKSGGENKHSYTTMENL